MSQMSGFGHVVESFTRFVTCQSCGRDLDFHDYGYDECNCEAAIEAKERATIAHRQREAIRMERQSRCENHKNLKFPNHGYVGCPWCPNK